MHKPNWVRFMKKGNAIRGQEEILCKQSWNPIINSNTYNYSMQKFIQTHSYLENNLASSRRATTPLPLSSAPKDRLYKNTNVVEWPLLTGHDWQHKEKPFCLNICKRSWNAIKQPPSIKRPEIILNSQNNNRQRKNIVNETSNVASNLFNVCK